MKTAAAFFAYFLQLQAKSKGEIAGGRWVVQFNFV
jgi:hypothetical protein